MVCHFLDPNYQDCPLWQHCKHSSVPSFSLHLWSDYWQLPARWVLMSYIKWRKHEGNLKVLGGYNYLKIHLPSKVTRFNVFRFYSVKLIGGKCLREWVSHHYQLQRKNLSVWSFGPSCALMLRWCSLYLYVTGCSCTRTEVCNNIISEQFFTHFLCILVRRVCGWHFVTSLKHPRC
jgi:hypothetical protein